MTKDERQILTDAIYHYGTKVQVVKACEEMAELQQALCKALTNGCMSRELWNHIAEEIADVEIMLWQVKHIYQNREQVQDWKDRKLDRLRWRMEADDAEKQKR